MKNNPQNPFDKYDGFSEIFINDKNFQAKSKAAFNLYFPQKNKFKSYFGLGFFKVFIFNNLIASIIFGVIIIGGFSVSGAELVAPNQFKPSTIAANLFNTNKVSQKTQEKDPYTKLIPDENYNVATLDLCDISIKYPKKVKGLEIGSQISKPDKYNPTLIQSINLDAKTQLESPINDSTIPVLNFGFYCYNQEFIAADDNAENYILVDKEILQQYTGWFISIEGGITNFKTGKYQVGQAFQTFTFNYNNKFYSIAFSTKINLSQEALDDEYTKNVALERSGIFGEDVQIQFNSLAKNISSK